MLKIEYIFRKKLLLKIADDFKVKPYYLASRWLVVQRYAVLNGSPISMQALKTAYVHHDQPAAGEKLGFEVVRYFEQ